MSSLPFPLLFDPAPARPHQDYGCITLLLPGDRGLQVHVGDMWREVPYVPGAFVVNFGDLLQVGRGCPCSLAAAVTWLRVCVQGGRGSVTHVAAFQHWG